MPPTAATVRRAGIRPASRKTFARSSSLVLPKPAAEHPFAPQYAQIEEKTFLPRLTGSENGIIPYQLHRLELRKILDNASAYLPFLLEEDEDGISVREKIEAVFSFRVPYYVGPLKGRWAERTEEAKRTGEKAYPWNFEKVVDLDASAAAFLKDLIGKCTYTGAPVLPKDSLLYSEFMLLNEPEPAASQRKRAPGQRKAAVDRRSVQKRKPPRDEKTHSGLSGHARLCRKNR